MIAIVALDRSNAIGKDGHLLVPISADLKRFKTLTMGKVLIYGRKTLDTFPGKKVLPGRKNLILSTGLKEGDVPGGEIVAGTTELLERLHQLEQEGYRKDDFCLIGGASVYRQLLPYCDRVSVTRIHALFAADAFFPDLASESFTLKQISPLQREGKWQFQYEEWFSDKA